jgi:hypothetical protein
MLRSCPACGTVLLETAISQLLEAGRCPKCEVLLDLRSGKRVSRLPAIEYPPPERWTIDDRFGRLQIRWRWWTWAVVPLTAAALFWNGILFAMGLGISDGFKHPERLLFGLVVPHVWVGVFFAYTALAGWVNSTRIECGGGELSVHIGPLPWRGRRRFVSRELTQLFVVERHGKGGSKYELCAVTRDGRRQVVVRGLARELEARFLETRLERTLGIEDRPVEGELRKLA